jgi:hypothetical protein
MALAVVLGAVSVERTRTAHGRPIGRLLGGMTCVAGAPNGKFARERNHVTAPACVVVARDGKDRFPQLGEVDLGGVGLR